MSVFYTPQILVTAENRLSPSTFTWMVDRRVEMRIYIIMKRLIAANGALMAEYPMWRLLRSAIEDRSMAVPR